jgi:hypothetical protein
MATSTAMPAVTEKFVTPWRNFPILPSAVLNAIADVPFVVASTLVVVFVHEEAVKSDSNAVPVSTTAPYGKWMVRFPLAVWKAPWHCGPVK